MKKETDLKELFYKRAKGEIKGDPIAAAERATFLTLWENGSQLTTRLLTSRSYWKVILGGLCQG